MLSVCVILSLYLCLSAMPLILNLDFLGQSNENLAVFRQLICILELKPVGDFCFSNVGLVWDIDSDLC